MGEASSGPARLTEADPLNEAVRPRAPKHPGAPISAAGRAGQQALVQIHGHLRQELAQIRAAVQAVADGASEPEVARTLINEMTMRQNYWSLGAFCAAYCRVLSIHHAIEDEHMFASIRRADDSLSPVLQRLGEEHEVIAEVLTDLDAALVAMVGDPSQLAAVRHAVDLLTDVLLSHLDYEEEELLEPIGRLSIRI